jgi:thiol-disulfide isomerase/thioredoxin
MGRLSAISAASLAAAVLVGAGCEGDPKKAALANAPRERSEVVLGSSASTALPPSPSAPPRSASAMASAPAARSPEGRKLCEGQLAKAGHELPKKAPAKKAAPSGRPLPPTTVPGRWTWVNLWAAWCAPCKEELPRLRSFAARLARSGKEPNLVFVSLDDDERQLEQFLSAEPDDGLRSTYWLREGHERDEWLAVVGLASDASLPAQLLVDPRGKLRCTVNGAVEERDFAEIAAIVSTP